MDGTYDYGYWFTAIVMSVITLVFAFSFTRPTNWRDWRSFGAFAAFIVALFTEMYGFPLTIYLLSGWLGSRYPALNLYAHENGHLWQTLFGGDTGGMLAAHFNLFHVVSNVLIAFGAILIIKAWDVLYKAQREGRLATTGPYLYVRHPQYAGFVAVLVGFLLQWPTLLTLAMFPVLVVMYARLARIEEREVRERLGAAYDTYAEQVPRFIPRRGVRYVPPLALPAPPMNDHPDEAALPSAAVSPPTGGVASLRAGASAEASSPYTPPTPAETAVLP